MLNHKGFTLIEVLVSMFCVSICLVLLMGGVQVMKHLAHFDYINEDRIAIRQLRVVLAQSEDIRANGSELECKLYMEDVRFVLHNNRLIKQKGYEIFLRDIDDADFVKQNTCTVIKWRRGEKHYEAILSCE